MHWIAPSESDTATDTLEIRLCAATEQVLPLQRRIQHLRRTRDLLLQRLLSGQVVRKE